MTVVGSPGTWAGSPAEAAHRGLPAGFPEDAVRRVHAARSWRGRGRVRSVVGPVVEAELPGARVGDGCRFQLPDGTRQGEVVGFDGGTARLLVLGPSLGIGPGTAVSLAGPAAVLAGDALLGRVLDPSGCPLDGRPPADPRRLVPVALDRPPPDPLSRPRIAEALPTGVRAIDGPCTLGRGQRVGLFAGPGVGKSTLLGELAAGARADVVVAALVGERGREVREVLEGPLAAARRRTVTVVATGDAPALLRARAAVTATALAEHFRDRGASVLLLVDSLTRYARALREVGLAAGEAPSRSGFPPSVFAALPRLLERAGTAPAGSITAVYTVLCEADEAADPVADEVRGLLDGHLVLSRRLAERGHWPALDPAASISRVAGQVTDPVHAAAAARLRAGFAAYEERRDLVVLGAWQPGADPEGDAAVAGWPGVEAFLRQPAGERTAFPDTVRRLCELGAPR